MVEEAFNANRAKESLLEILNELNENGEVKKLREAYQDDKIGYTQLVIELSIDIQFKIIEKYGFSNDINGLVKFNNLVNQLSEESTEVKLLFNQLRSFLTSTDSV